MDKFIDRRHAGIVLARYLKAYADQSNVIIFALPRGGVPVAYEVALALSLPLDVFIVRKLGVPGHAELAMGAIASGGTVSFNAELMHQLNLDQASINAVLATEQTELIRREHVYRGQRPFPDVLGKTIILVDDGMATGATMRVAAQALRQYKPAAIIIAVPVAATETCAQMSTLVEKIICPLQLTNFHAVGLWYVNFSQTTDNEVVELLEQSL